MISLSLTSAEAIAVHRALDRESRSWGCATPEAALAVAIAARLAPAIIADARAETVEAPTEAIAP